jgi:hypothetical protein
MANTSAIKLRHDLSIASIEAVSAAEWDAIWHACDYATYFHSREWSELWSRHEPDGLLSTGKIAVFSDGARALLPYTLRLRANGLLDSYSSSADAMYGGWIARDRLNAEHACLLAQHLLARPDASLSWRINPYDPNHDWVLRIVAGECVRLDGANPRYAKALKAVTHFGRPLVLPDLTHALNLEPGFEQLFRKKSGVMRDAGKAASEGVTIEVAEHVEQWREYYEVYLDSLGRWGMDPADAYRWSLFESMFALHSPNVRLWVAVHGSRIISGALCLSAKHHVAYWHGAALQRFFQLGSVNLLMLEIIRDACHRGRRWYDFNPSGNQGIVNFKKKFRPQELGCPMVFVDRPIKRAARTVLMSMGR